VNVDFSDAKNLANIEKKVNTKVTMGTKNQRLKMKQMKTSVSFD